LGTRTVVDGRADRFERSSEVVVIPQISRAILARAGGLSAALHLITGTRHGTPGRAYPTPLDDRTRTRTVSVGQIKGKGCGQPEWTGGTSEGKMTFSLVQRGAGLNMVSYSDAERPHDEHDMRSRSPDAPGHPGEPFPPRQTR
jgi:hypothetical protein